VDELAAYLASKGYSALPYHAGLEDSERRKNQEAFIRDDAQIIVATIAFGMGINKPNVRFIIHFDLPKSIEGYYQEIGRAGRDGLPAYCTLLFSYSDVAKINYFIDQKAGEEKRVAIGHLDAIVRFAEDETTCRRRPLLNYFGESISAHTCSNCDNCTSAPTALTDITVFAQKFLSCVKRADEKFGAGHIADILLGSKNEKVLRWGHDKLSTYGIGTELTKKQWMHLARQLLTMGYLAGRRVPYVEPYCQGAGCAQETGNNHGRRPGGGTSPEKGEKERGVGVQPRAVRHPASKAQGDGRRGASHRTSSSRTGHSLKWRRTTRRRLRACSISPAWGR
jgi:ATP-dependent DNA helicase RecQ